MIVFRSYHRKKYTVILLLFLLMFMTLAGRLLYIMIYKAEYYDELATDLHERERSIKAPRGIIYDRNGNVLADNKAVCSISVIHSQIEDSQLVIDTLCDYLSLDADEVREKVEKNSSREIIATNIDKTVADQIRTLDIAGIKVDEDYKRYYPYGSLASKVLGFTGADNQGIVGLEVEYDSVLSGVDGSINTLTDSSGIELSEMAETRVEPVAGNNLVTTIDLNIQRYATQAAEKVLQEKDANRVSIIIMNPQNGEIYAMVDVPEYDLNDPFNLEYVSATGYDMAKELLSKLSYKSDEDETSDKMDALNNMWRNFNISDTYEPGSIFKIVTATAALETGAADLDSTFYCPGYKIVEDRRIRCAKTTGHGSETFKEALLNSCNPAFMEIGAMTGVDNIYTYFDRLGLFSQTGIDLPGEANSIMHDKEDVGPVELAVMSFGQSFQITPIQLITAAATVVNGGDRITPHIGAYVTDADHNILETLEYDVEENVIEDETSAIMRELLQAVVDEGGGSRAQIEGYAIGGKTATSEKLPRGTGLYISAFLGFAPADNPQVMALVLIDEPEGVYYGGTIAAPVVKEIFENILPYLGIRQTE